jgi:beta-galactosidase
LRAHTPFGPQRGVGPGAGQSSFDDSAWTPLDVPHDWSVDLAFDPNSPAGAGGGYLDGGIGWYRKSFAIPAAMSGQRVYLQFDGVYMDSTVWVNGVSIGNRPYGLLVIRIRHHGRRALRRSQRRCRGGEQPAAE